MKFLPTTLLAGALAIGIGNPALAQGQASPAASPHAQQNPALKSPKRMTGVPLAKGHNSFTSTEARNRIRKAGYSDVQNLKLDPDGLWQGTALRRGQRLHVALDYKGNVASR
ncbi:hypothetical protein NDN01_17935 [Sphingomonas sp. QA11]|uniref:hypothetical protein n=1 Tax=Sphingomonas sp. QA11 TaxID=2950605 RepID=UPI00234B9BF7|nr:hypothetical protein [Sphingomonas sp. QA11]WCM25893.1 hypothetical protein NDN01_17935 [Sphingomonas sp. QA11]